MAVTQSQFTKALLDPDASVPDGVVDPKGSRSAKRFAVYRNNVAVSLTEALQTAFPVVFKLVGEDFFKAMASVFLRRHPPTCPLMMHYGAEMPAFLETFTPAQSIGYLPDVARLEQALRSSYHAADAEAVEPDALAQLSAEALMSARMTFSPALRIVRSPWPIHSIWRANMEADAPAPRMQAEDVMITRPEFDPGINTLPNGGAVFIDTLAASATFGTAFDAAITKTPDFNLSATLALLLGKGAITAITNETDPT